MVIAGFTGRNQKEVRRHIEELAVKGIPGPQKTPTLYPVIRRALLTEADEIEVYSDRTCCEAEYVLLVENEKRIFVGIGSDHTDRHLEKTDIPRAKQICPNLTSKSVWPLEDVVDHWDRIVMRCRQVDDDRELLYQEGPLELIMAPQELMEYVKSAIPGPLDGYAIFSGTIGNLTKGFVFGQRVIVELEDPVIGRKLELSYDVRALDYLEL